jgi:carboxyl-terminal processing protease
MSLVVLMGCGHNQGTESRGERAVALAELRGVWRQRGYARVVEVTDAAVHFYDVTQVSCTPSGDVSLEQAEAEYDRISGNEDRFSWYESGAFTRYEFDRFAALPETCATPATDPVSTFESLWHAFAENYAYFSVRGVDWEQTYSEFRPRVDETTTGEELTDIFEDMLTPLNDGHVYVFDPVNGTGFLAAGLGELWDAWAAQYPGDDFGENPADPRGAFTAAMQEYVLDRVLYGNGSSGVYDMLHWGWLDADVAYLDVHAMATFEAEMTVPEALVRIDETMAQAMHDLAGARAFVVDVRFNQGGMDSIGYAITSWFAAESRLVSRKRAWLGDAWGPPQDITVTSRPNAFTGPVVLLLGKNSVSAAETFAIAMHALPNVTSVGTSTYGSLSDTLVRNLPNGWIFSQSNESYESPEGEQYEVTGVPADVEVAADPQLDYSENLAATLARALELLGE